MSDGASVLKGCCSLRDEDTLTTLPLLGTLDVLPYSLCHRCLQYVPETTRRVWLFLWGFFAKRTMRKDILHPLSTLNGRGCLHEDTLPHHHQATTTTTTPSATESEMSEQLNCCCNAHLPKKSRPTGHRNFMQNFGIRPKTLRFNLWLVMTIGLQCKHCDYGIE